MTQDATPSARAEPLPHEGEVLRRRFGWRVRRGGLERHPAVVADLADRGDDAVPVQPAFAEVLAAWVLGVRDVDLFAEQLDLRDGIVAEAEPVAGVVISSDAARSDAVD